MQERLEGLVQAVNMVEPPLAKFYDLLERRAESPLQRYRRSSREAVGARQAGCAKSANRVRRKRHGVSDRADRPHRAAERRAARESSMPCRQPMPRRQIWSKAACPSQLQHSAGPSRRRGQAAASHAGGRADDQTSARRFLHLAERRAEGARFNTLAGNCLRRGKPSFRGAPGMTAQ